MEGENRETRDRLPFINGVKAGIQVAVGYIPIAITFGLLAKSAGIPVFIAVMMSLLVFGGASQFVAVNLLAVGVTHWEIVMTTFILNLRHFLMTAYLSQRISRETSKKRMALLSFGTTDETFSVASLRGEQNISSEFVLGLNLIAFSAWNVGTWMGVFLGAGLPESVQNSMGIALYAMFIGLLVPTLKKSRPVLIVSLLAAGIHAMLKWLPVLKTLSAGWAIMTATIIAAAIGAILFPEGVNG